MNSASDDEFTTAIEPSGIRVYGRDEPVAHADAFLSGLRVRVDLGRHPEAWVEILIGWREINEARKKVADFLAKKIPEMGADVTDKPPTWRGGAES